MLVRLPPYRQQLILAVGSLLLAMASVAPAWAQFERVWAAEELQIGQHTNLFSRWSGRTELDGVFVELPSGWSLEGALALRQGYERVPLRVKALQPSGTIYVVSAPHRLRGMHDLVLHIQTGGAPGQALWSIVPFVHRSDDGHARQIPRESYRVAQAVRQVTPFHANDNQVLAFRGDGPAWLLRSEALPDLDTQAAYTVEFWMRTTDFQEVLLSTWTGEENTAYPLELIVDAGGRLRYYRGQPEQHASMATPNPVADGQWHHVALTHNPDAGWTRLFLDGQAVDSLYSPVPPAIEPRSTVALGGRLPTPNTTGQIGGYTGLLDELRFWPRTRRIAEIRGTMRQPLAPLGEELVLLNFDQEAPDHLVVERVLRAERVFSDLTFYHPVRDMQAVVEETGVTLTWETSDAHTTSFVIERSTDERIFEVIGEVTKPEADRRRTDEAGHFVFYDLDVSAQVVFYRIRQRFQGGNEQLSGTIKIGLGSEEEEGAVLLGNFPNPFNPNTTILYEVQEAQRVRISVWDLSGQMVGVLIDRGHQPGQFEVGFEGSDLPSGTYFVRLQSSYGPMQTHKMVLMK